VNEYEIADMGDEAGDFEITGEDIAAAPRGLTAPRGAPPGVVREPPPRRRLSQTMPFNTLVLAAGATGVLTAQPQRPIRLERLFLDSPTAGGLSNFAVSNIVIGADQQFVNTGNAPAIMFSFNAVGANLRGTTANPGIVIAITVVNVSGAPATIGGAVIGTSLE